MVEYMDLTNPPENTGDDGYDDLFSNTFDTFASDEESARNLFELILLGITMGIVHVLTGPEDLSALAALCTNKTASEAVGYGLRWGLGHSIGLALIGLIFVAINKGGDMELAPEVHHTLVLIGAILMIILGLYGIMKVCLRKKTKTEIDIELANAAPPAVPCKPVTSTSEMESKYNNTFKNISANICSSQCGGAEEENSEQEGGGFFSMMNHSHLHPHGFPTENPTSSTINKQLNGAYKAMPAKAQKSSNVSNCMAFCIGLFHGLVEPSGVLGVLPAIQVTEAWLSAVYLIVFCFTTIIFTAFFAFVYSSCTSYLAKRGSCGDFLEIFGSAMSLSFGVLICALVATGEIDHIFPS